MFVKRFVNARTCRFSARNIRDVVHVIRVDRLWVQSAETLRYEGPAADLGMPRRCISLSLSLTRACPLSASDYPINTSREGYLDTSSVHPSASATVESPSHPLPTFSHTRSSITTWFQGVSLHIMRSPDSEVPNCNTFPVFPLKQRLPM